MLDFTVHFLISNIVISFIAISLLAAKHVLQNILTGRTQYNLWFLLLGILAVPFLPLGKLPSLPFRQVLSWFREWAPASSLSENGGTSGTAAFSPAGTYSWMNDFSISVSSKAPSPLVTLLFIIWIAGILLMCLRFAGSSIRLHRIRKSALPLQSDAVYSIYQSCLTEMKITRKIPIYSTAFLKSPVIAGLFRPCIYLPIRLVSDLHAAAPFAIGSFAAESSSARPNSGLPASSEMRYMLLHELQHYKHKDAFANAWINLAHMLYWFNPVVLYVLKQMRCDREIACDASVLQMLSQEDYEHYGNTLINYAEKLSAAAFPFAAGLSGNLQQMKKRILRIAAYRPASGKKRAGNLALFLCIALLLSCFIPVLSAGAGSRSRYVFPEDDRHITYADYSAVFGENQGSFVLYDAARDTWTIHDREAALTRIPPASTYKIYAALHALENDIITPDQSLISWNGMRYPYDTWNTDQTLETAMANSVTWYFQTLDRQMGMESVKEFIREIGYGNQVVEGDLSSYWLNFSLKISPVEQVELLRKFHDGNLPFSPENISAVKDSIRLAVTESGTLYGKTGTESVDGKNPSGWFIGYVESGDETYYFAANIRNEDHATGTAATALAFEILAEMGVWAP